MTGYHDLYVTTDTLPRQRLFDMPYGFEVTCNRTTGWQLWFHATDESNMLQSAKIAEEFPRDGTPTGLKLDVNGVVLCDSLTNKPQ